GRTPPARSAGRLTIRRAAAQMAIIIDPHSVDLTHHGLHTSGRVYRQPTTSLLYTHALARGEGRLAEGGPLVVDTGRYTGRSPKPSRPTRRPTGRAPGPSSSSTRAGSRC